ncbi:MAG: hypothetical protein LJE93_14605 [Acidobacteria bacterium]|jgi:hypothetical protein|nr:hypothetical protein [Acidobacteriota bacterium]
MSRKKPDVLATLADALDVTCWDYSPSRDGRVLLRPAGSVFAELPWEIQPQHLAPAGGATDEDTNETSATHRTSRKAG